MKQKHKKQSSRIRNVSIVLLVFILLFFIIAFIIIRNVNSNILVHAKVNTTVKIGDYVGIKLDTDKLHFGTTSTSGYSEREFTLFQGNKGYIYLTANEPMAEWLFYPAVDKQEIDPWVNRSIVMYAVPRGKNAVPGEYESTIDVWVLKERPSWLTKQLLGGIEIRGIDPADIKYPKVSITIVPQNSTNSTKNK